MKFKLGLLTSLLVLAGCATNPTAQQSEAQPAAATTSTSTPASPAAANAASTTTSASSATPCTSANAAASEQRKTSSKKKKTKGKNAASKGKTVAAQPCTTPPAAADQKAAVPLDPNKREVKGINDWTGYVQGTPAPKSRFNAVKIGMGQKEVTDLIGPPSDQRSNVTGKAWIPFYFGSGMTETMYYYKGLGRLLFASNAGFTTSTGLIGIEHDAKERGYAE